MKFKIGDKVTIKSNVDDGSWSDAIGVIQKVHDDGYSVVVLGIPYYFMNKELEPYKELNLNKEKSEQKEFTFNFYLHAGENWPLENHKQCKENLTKEQLNECKYFCSEVKLGIKFSNGVFTLDSFSGIDVSDKNIILYTI